MVMHRRAVDLVDDVEHERSAPDQRAGGQLPNADMLERYWQEARIVHDERVRALGLRLGEPDVRRALMSSHDEGDAVLTDRAHRPGLGLDGTTGRPLQLDAQHV